jgi:formylglycine-generating enzyme required for sulfatase activity
VHVRSLVSAALVATACGLPLRAQAPSAQPPGISWVKVPAGSFQMGCVPADMRCDADERPRHAVTLTRPFEIMATEVTAGMYRAVAKEVDEQPAWSTSPDHPITIVTWNEALSFCVATGGRLPSEAEWEFAARGGRPDLIYPWGDQDPDDRDKLPNGAAFESDSARPVRSFAPNGYGVYDMAGNVWEWVTNNYAVYGGDPVTDPTGPEGGRFRVVRGGSYGDDSRNLRVSNRNPNQPGNANLNVGFRCARDVRQ